MAAVRCTASMMKISIKHRASYVDLKLGSTRRCSAHPRFSPVARCKTPQSRVPQTSIVHRPTNHSSETQLPLSVSEKLHLLAQNIIFANRPTSPIPALQPNTELQQQARHHSVAETQQI